MSIMDRFRRMKQEEKRKEEINYRVKVADVKRQAQKMKNCTEKAKTEACRLEMNGDHAAAVSKALEAANSEKAYQTALETLRRCENMHAQARTQNDLTDLLKDCESVSKKVIDQIDIKGATIAKEKLQQTNVLMEQMQQSMLEFQDGFDPAGEELFDLSGEEELAAIMASCSQDVEPAQSDLMQENPETENKGQNELEERALWLAARRKELAEI